MTPTARTPPTAAPDRILRRPYRGLTIGLLATVMLVAFEALAVATAMPVVADDLDGLSLYAWAFSGFFAASLVGMVAAGEVSDARGPRLPFLAGVATFGAGLLVAGTAGSMAVLVAGRVVQGLGVGSLIVALYVIVASAYPVELRPRAFGALATGWVVPSLIGPALAGIVAEHWTWRAVFLGVLVLVVPGVLLMVPQLARLDGRRGAAVRPARIGVAVAAAVGLALLHYAGQHLSRSSGPALVLAAVLLVPSVPRLLPPGTLRLARGLPTLVAQRGLLMGALLGAETFLPLMLVTERDVAPAVAGTVFTGGALSWALASWWQGRGRLRVPRWLLIRLGGFLLAAGIVVAASALHPAVPPLVAVAGWVVVGTGLGLAVPSVTVELFALSPPEEHGGASAAVQVSDALGSVVFVAVAGVLHAALHSGDGDDGFAFAVIFAAMALLAAATGLAAGRVRPEPHRRAAPPTP